jgi:polyribonucleotide nucleotidyltransferase
MEAISEVVIGGKIETRIHNEFSGKGTVRETGELAQLANGFRIYFLRRHGGHGNCLHGKGSAGKRRHFPLSVITKKKLYAVGKIPGGFLKERGQSQRKGDAQRQTERQAPAPSV